MRTVNLRKLLFPPSASNGRHFKGSDVEIVCKEFGIEHQTTAAYVDHANGLVEMENELLLTVLAKLCTSDAPNNQGRVSSEWPLVFFREVNLINNRVTPILGTSPRAVMFGTRSDYIDHEVLEDLDSDSAVRFVFLDMERDNAEETLRKTQRLRKEMFDKRAKVQTFEPGDTGLVYNSSLASNKESNLNCPLDGSVLSSSTVAITSSQPLHRKNARRWNSIRPRSCDPLEEIYIKGFSRLQLQEVERIADDIICNDQYEENQPNELEPAPRTTQTPNQGLFLNENTSAPASLTPDPIQELTEHLGPHCRDELEGGLRGTTKS